MKRKIELLAPGGDIDSIKAAILAGADAVYCGLDKFNARNKAANIHFDDLQGILRLAHKNNCAVFLTLNIIILESEIPAIFSLLNKLMNTSIDGIIIQDIGMFYLLSNYFKDLKIHASTQLTTHNQGQIEFLSKLNAGRINLSRELNINEIKVLTGVAHKNNVLTEVFVHGSQCISFSGICYMSSVHGGKSGNRGRCGQPCRDSYITTTEGKNYPLNLKDNSAYSDLIKLADAGIDALKIEGRIKKSDYVYTVVKTWREQLQRFINTNKINYDNSDLYKVFNRDFSNSFLKGEIHKNMFIDNPRDHSIQHLSEIYTYDSVYNLEKEHLKLFDEKEMNKNTVEDKIRQISISKAPLILSISGECGSPLKITVTTPDTKFVVISDTNLMNNAKHPLDFEMVFKRLKVINETEYYIKHLDLDNLQHGVFLSFTSLTSIKKRLLFILNGSKVTIDPIDVPVLKKQIKAKIKPSLAILISSQKDVYLCYETVSDIYFKLPDCFKNEAAAITNLFKKHKKLIPWFPSVLIGEDFNAAVEFLKKVKPKLIVTNNTGVAYEAYKNGILWIAGPGLNIVNSFSLLCLKENFNCYGAFISNEISKIQIQRIICPENFRLYYSIYQPIELMTSRQCLFHQITGCEKDRIDKDCIQQCDKSSSITNFKKQTFNIIKTKGNYHRIFHDFHLLNTDIVNEIPDLFSGFFIDVSDIKTFTNNEIDKSEIIHLFKNVLNGKPDAEKVLNQIIYPTSNTQYNKGI